MPQLRLRRVSRTFPAVIPTHALRDVTVSVEQGDFIAIEGPSGGGKSTLLNVIGLLDSPTAGEYVIDDVVTGAISEKALAELRSNSFGFIFQNFHLLDRRPVLDSVELGLLYRDVPVAARRERALAALRRVGLEDRAWQPAGTLSGGERQRVAIARAFASAAPIVVADEPTGNLDEENSRSIVNALKDLNRNGTTVVLVTHSAEVAAVADRRIRLRDGRITEGSPNAAVPPPPRVVPFPPGRPSRLRALDLIVDSWRSVRSRVGRSAGLVFAVAVGVALAVATLGISDSASSQVSSTFNAHTNRDVTAQWQEGELAVQTPTMRSTIADRLAALKGVDAAGMLETYDNHSVQVANDRPAFQVTADTVTPNLLTAARATVRWAPGTDHVLRPGEILLGAGLGRQLNVGPLAGEPVISVDGRRVTVVGIVDKSPRNPDILGAVVAPTSDATVLGQPTSVQALVLTRAGAAQQVAGQVPLVIDPYQPSAVTVDAPVDPTTLRSQVENDVRNTLIALTGIALLASIAGLANAMVLAVIERRHELGLRRALGARPTHLVSLILSESTILGAIGGASGLALGLSTVLIITIAQHWAPVFDLALAPLAIVGGIAVGALGGILAAIRASRIQPGEALRL